MKNFCGVGRICKGYNHIMPWWLIIYRKRKQKPCYYQKINPKLLSFAFILKMISIIFIKNWFITETLRIYEIAADKWFKFKSQIELIPNQSIISTMIFQDKFLELDWKNSCYILISFEDFSLTIFLYKKTLDSNEIKRNGNCIEDRSSSFLILAL